MKQIRVLSARIARKSRAKCFVILLMNLCLPGIWFSLELVQAASPITPSGLNTQVTLSGSPPPGKTQYDIAGGTRPGGGTNLFHSFGDFSVPTNNIANFLNSGSVDLAGNPLSSGLPTSNILGRVTGGNPSSIFGTIQTNGAGGFGNANLFLMNPAGVVFGPTATLNVGGMAVFTTADYLKLTDGKVFNATPNPAADALLSAAPVTAFGFLGNNPAAIAVQGSTLSVQPDQSISLVGGNQGFTYANPDTGINAQVVGGVTMTAGKLSAPGGQVNIASVASPGEVVAGTLDYAPNVNGQSFGALGSINISQKSVVDVSGNGGGTVLIRGGQFLLDNSTISANVTGAGSIANGLEAIGGGIDIQVSQAAVIQNGGLLTTNEVSSATSGVTYGGVHVRADQITIAGKGPGPVITGIQSDVQPGAPGASSGDITLEANSILLKGNAILDTRVTGLTTQLSTGNSGNINVTANQNIQLNQTQIASVITNSSGASGNITFTSSHGSIIESGFVPPAGSVPPPGVPIIANVIFLQSTGASTGKPGRLTFNAPEGDVVLAGAVVPISIQPSVQVAGGGELNITANNLQLINGSSLQVDNFSTVPSGIFNIALKGNLTLDNGARIVTTARGPARAAELDITAYDVLVTNGGSLSTQTASSGPGGPMNIHADTIQITNKGQITSGSPVSVSLIPLTGPGGTITLQGINGPATSLLIDGAGSGIFTSTVGTGAAGNTNISAQSLTIQNGGTISAATSGTAPSAIGGTININTNQVQVNSGGLITASTTGAGAGGSVTINAGSTFTSNGGTVSTTASQAAGGDITIGAGQSVTLNNGASISASSTGTGNAGSIMINAGQNYTSTNSSVTTEASHASGGNITVLATDNVELTNSQINASVQGATTTVGGNITIDPQAVILQNSQILAQATQGQGGNISITTNVFLPDSTSVVSASSQFGVSGNVAIQSPISQGAGQLSPLPKNPLINAALLSQRCAVLAQGQVSSFTVAGRDTLPVEPGGWLTSPLLAAVSPDMGSSVNDGAISSLSGDTTILSLRRLPSPSVVAAQLTTEDWLSGCGS